MRKINVMSCFDGIACLRVVLDKLGIKVNKYYACEIDESAMSISMFNYPDIIQLGDITKVSHKGLPRIDLIAAGSPCTDFSMMGRKKGMTTFNKIDITSLDQYLKLKEMGYQFDEKSQSYLFWEFIRLLRELKPKYFFFENVKMDPKWLHVISVELGVLPIRINSSLVSGQNRDRFYWTNIPGVSIPKDRNIMMSDVIPNSIGGYGVRGVDTGQFKPNGKVLWKQIGTTRKDGKSNCITTVKYGTGKVKMKNGEIRNLTIEEAEKLQTLPKNYTNVPNVSDTKKWRAIGNGWTIDVVSHILKELKNCFGNK